MKVAFVSYPTATLLPPYYGSMGASTYMNASALAKTCKVIVYGLQDSQRGSPSGTMNGVTYAFLNATNADKLRNKLRQNASRLIQFRTPISTSSSLFPDFGRQVARELQKEHCDVIHIQHCPQYAEVIRAFNPASKIILHLHAEMYSQMNFNLLRRRFSHVDWIFTVSDYLTERLRRDFPEMGGRCETMHDAIDLSEFVREKDYKAAAFRKEKRILYAGGVWPHKGAHVALDAFEQIVDLCPDARLDIVGPEGSYPLEECFDLADKDLLQNVAPYFAKDQWRFIKSKLSRTPHISSYVRTLKSKLSPAIAKKVTFHGFVSRPELIDHFYNADVFVFPPIWNEAFGCTPLEAMAAGTPVVVSSSGGIVETVLDNKTGFIVDKHDSRTLARRVLQLMEDDRLRELMGRAGRRRAFEKFDWNMVAGSMLGRYRQLCGIQNQTELGQESRVSERIIS